jgi:hypothetical protein
MRTMRNACVIFARKPEGNILIQGPTLRCEDNVEMYVKEEGVKLWKEFIWMRVETI